MDAQELLRVFHEQVRLRDRDVAPEWTLERVGKVRRSYADDGSGQGFAESPEGLDDPDAEIAAEVEFFTARGQAFGRSSGRPTTTTSRRTCRSG